MKVIEQFLESKTGDDSKCEDGIFVSDDFLAVIDGSSGQTKKIYNGKTTAQIAKDLILQTLPNLSKEIKAHDAIVACDSAIRQWYRDNDLYDYMKKYPVERCCATLIVYSNFHRELWMVGDCQALVDQSHITYPIFIEYLYTNIRAFYLETELKKGKTEKELRENDTGRAFIQPLITEQALLQNTDSHYGFYMLDGFFQKTFPIKIVDVGSNTKQLILASDGYPELHPTLETSENALAHIVKNDPLGFRLIKSVRAVRENGNAFDDRAYLRVELT